MLQELTNEQKELLLKVQSYADSTELKKFISLIYEPLPYEEMKDFDPEYLFKTAKSTFQLLQQRTPGQCKVSIFKPDKNEDLVVLEVINDDVSFLVDSLSNQLKFEDFDIHLIAHPSIALKRDAEHNLVSLDESSSYKEAIMQFHLSKWVNDEYYPQLIKRIEDILECVNHSVQDWGAMKQEMANAKQYITEFKALSKEQSAEMLSFLDWLIEGNFIFLGVYRSKAENKEIIAIEESKLGLTKAHLYPITKELLDEQYSDQDVLFFRKWDTRSVVHRTAHMDHIIIKKFDNKGKCIEAYNFIGFFTSSVYYQSVRNIPLIRTKINSIIKRYGYAESSHNCKELVTALEGFPRGELIQMSEDELYDTATGTVSLMLMPRVKLFLRRDRADKFISCLIFIPRNRFSTDIREAIEKILCRAFNGFVSKQYVNISESQLARMQILVRTQPNSIPAYNINELEELIKQVVSSWNDELYLSLQRRYNKKDAKAKYNVFKDAFDIKYTSTFSAKQSVHDIDMIELAENENKVKFDLYQSRYNDKDIIELKIYSPDVELPLSSTLPILEHLGFFALDVVTYPIHLKNIEIERTFWIYHFHLQSKMLDLQLSATAKQNLIALLDKAWAKEIEDDRFNSLALYCELSWRQIDMLRAYAKYFKQIGFPLMPQFIVDALVNNQNIVKSLVEYFEAKFDPNTSQGKPQLEILMEKINSDLVAVRSILEDKVLRAYLNIITATKRTNYYQPYKNGLIKEYISFKIASSEVLDIPEPKPFMEIWVCSKRFEAIHLRGGKVARGGLRWSDRSEDFRTEVLGLMKAQMTKNAVIVPMGSKGGFIVKRNAGDMTRDEWLQEGIACYKLFLSGLLDVTDNVVDSKIIPPINVLRHDEDDPYLVVAADKGTATFSDYANRVSKDYGFWLGDAFASGGSAGYDHKKMAITAKGAWVSVEQHFRELNRKIRIEPFSVVGIGDMSGDVFGNGMLLSKNIKLVAAFNHMHIFLDPNPEVLISFEERKRLFELPRSQWSDYNSQLLSEGGAIHNRSEKFITISKQMMQVLDVQRDTFTPDNLIKAILSAPVDLLWNGGIGTYVKSSLETNEMIGDKANDSLRINGKDLRCLLVGEGGNLGFTQRGRIEYAKHGGKINTDGIDNSAGVDCSDHEVNIKIAFSDIIHADEISIKERDAILDQMTDTVAELVLEDNHNQTRIISIEEDMGKKKLDQHAWLIKTMETKGELDRGLEFLPTSEELSALKVEGGKLTRPEIAVLIAYSKNSIVRMLADYDFSRDKFFEKILTSYFPNILVEKFHNAILNHKLKNEIIATVLTNRFVNRLGCSFFHQLIESTGVSPITLVKAFAVMMEIFEIKEYWDEVERLSGIVPADIKLQLFQELQKFLERNITWLLRRNNNFDDISSIVAFYKTKVHTLWLEHRSVATEAMLHEIEDFKKRFADYQDSTAVVEKIAFLKVMGAACDIAMLAAEVNEDVLKIGKIFYTLGEKMHIHWMLEQAKQVNYNQYVENIALRSLIAEIEDLQIALVRKELYIQREDKNLVSDNADSYCLIKPAACANFDQFIMELKGSSAESWIALLIVVIKRLKEFLDA